MNQKLDPDRNQAISHFMFSSVAHCYKQLTEELALQVSKVFEQVKITMSTKIKMIKSLINYMIFHDVFLQ